MSWKILLADDSVTAQNMGRRILSEAGYEVVTVNNGPAALKKLAEFKPDLVILDIYMPGYGGLEVCQRIKESAETASLPVLLTVGKLEPFKADEARRVRADAHLVKPFEATELLAALIKLEDKIVARPAPGTPGKAAKGKASNAAPTAVKEKKFGDTVSGWKQRLTIPPPPAKRGEAEASEAANTAFRAFSRSEAQEGAEPATLHHEPLTADITAEEIAAITAAAAAFENRSGLQEPEHRADAVTEEEIVAAVSSAPAPLEEMPEPVAEIALEASPVPEPAFAADLAAAAEYQSETMEASADPEVSAAETHAPPDSATDAEVAAMLESLAPVSGIDTYFKGIPDGEALAAHDHVIEEALAQMGAGWRNIARGGARWIAEQVAVPQSEASLILEEEMQRAYAVLAESQPEVSSFAAEAELAPGHASGNGAGEAVVAEAYEARAEEQEQEDVPSPAGDLEAAAVASQEPEPLMAAMAAEAEAYNFAALVELSAPAEPTEELRTDEPRTEDPGTEDPGTEEAREEIAAQEPDSGNISPVVLIHDAIQGEVQGAIQNGVRDEIGDEVGDEVREDVRDDVHGDVQDYKEPEPAEPLAESAEPVTMAVGTADENAIPEESAYAAAAGTEFHTISHVEATTPAAPVEQFESAAPAAPAVAPEHEAELAAAWAHWRQIRESVANPQFASQLADAAAAGYKEIHQLEPIAPELSDTSAADDESSAAVSADSATIASIVDSVLAELKPKLVAEIARKLRKEKK